MSWLLDMAISVILTAIKESIKNKKSKAESKKAFLKVRNAINALYAGDKDFE